MARAVELERIHEKGLFVRDEEIQAERLIARGLGEAADAPAAITDGAPDLLVALLDLEIAARSFGWSCDRSS